MNTLKLFLLFIVFTFTTAKSYAQVPVKIVAGNIVVGDTYFILYRTKYISYIDTLDKKLKANPSDTTSLFFKAVLLCQLNNVVAKPYQGATCALEGLNVAECLAEKAIDLKMHDFRLKVLRAEIHRELCYRYTGDESWKYNSKQAAKRRAQFNNYKNLAITMNWQQSMGAMPTTIKN